MDVREMQMEIGLLCELFVTILRMYSQFFTVEKPTAKVSLHMDTRPGTCGQTQYQLRKFLKRLQMISSKKEI